MVRPIAGLSLQLPEPEISRVLSQCDPVANGIDLSLLEDEPVPRSFQAHRPVLDEAWPAQPPGSRRYDPKQNFRLPLELEILTNRRCAPMLALLAQTSVLAGRR